MFVACDQAESMLFGKSADPDVIFRYGTALYKQGVLDHPVFPGRCQVNTKDRVGFGQLIDPF